MGSAAQLLREHPLDRRIQRLTELGREIQELAGELVATDRHPGGALITLHPERDQAESIETAAVPPQGARVMVVRASSPRHVRLLTGVARSPNRLLTFSERDVAILVANRDGCEDRASALALIEGAIRYDADALAGISSPIRTPEEIEAAHREASELADLAQSRSDSHLLADDAWAHLALRRLTSLVSEALPREHPMRRLAAYDRKRRSELARSVYAWITSNGDVAQAATSLHVHPNTLRYRLQRAEQISGLRLHDADERLLFQLAYRASNVE